jgi:hypothetical protein
VIEPQPCCVQALNDLHAAHRRVGDLERMMLALTAQVSDLTTRLADVTMQRDKLIRAQAATTIHNIQERAA